MGFEDHRGQEVVHTQLKVTKEKMGVVQGVEGIRVLSWDENFRWPPMSMYIHPIIIFSLLAAWPRIAFKDRLKLFGIALPLLFVVTMIDVPLLKLSRCEAHAHSLPVSYTHLRAHET